MSSGFAFSSGLWLSKWSSSQSEMTEQVIHYFLFIYAAFGGLQGENCPRIYIFFLCAITHRIFFDIADSLTQEFVFSSVP